MIDYRLKGVDATGKPVWVPAETVQALKTPAPEPLVEYEWRERWGWGKRLVAFAIALWIGSRLAVVLIVAFS